MRFLLTFKLVALATFFMASFDAIASEEATASVEAAAQDAASLEAAAQDAACQLTIEANDRMQFNTLTMEAPASCAEITVTLTHTGQLPREGMGHNWVLTASGDFNDVANEGMKAGLANNYMPVGDTRVIAGTEIIGGGDTTSVTFSTSGMTAGGEYTYFCSFPGHWGMMKGAFKLV